MTKIFVGFLFAFLNFNLHIGSGTLGLVPDFVGYLLLLLGAKELAGESDYFTKVQPYFLGLTIYDAIVWLMNLLGRNGTIVATLLSLASIVVGLYATYQLFKGFEDMQNRYGTDLNAGQCLAMWKINAIVSVCAVVLSWLPIINVLLLIASLVVVILLLMAVNKAKNLYNNLPRGTVL